MGNDLISDNLSLFRNVMSLSTPNISNLASAFSRHFSHLVILVAVSIPFAHAKPQNVTEAEMKLIPAYCPDTQGFGYGDAFSNTSPRAGHWVGLMGNSFWHMHHYCWARISMNRAQRSTTPPRRKKALWEAALSDYQYVIDHVPGDFVLLPEVYTRKGEAELLLGQPNKANEVFARARQLKPDYWPAYSNWAEYLIKVGKRAEALKVVAEGLSYSPEARVLLEQFKILGGKPSDIQPHLKNREANAPSTATKHPAADQQDSR